MCARTFCFLILQVILLLTTDLCASAEAKGVKESERPETIEVESNIKKEDVAHQEGTFMAKLEQVIRLRKNMGLALDRNGKKDTESRVAAEEYLALVKETCTPEALVVDLDERDANTKSLPTTTLDTLATIMNSCGLVAIPNAFSSNQIDQAASVLMEHYYETGVSNSHSRPRGDELRKEVVCPLTPTFTNLTSAPAIVQTAQHILGTTSIELDTFSYIFSEAGSSDQAWHSDLSPIEEGQVSLPPYGLVMIVPFVDLNDQNGPTEFVPGSHHLQPNPAAIQPKQQADDTSIVWPTVSLELPRGSALFFDIRTTHRGKANDSWSARPILYASFFREWFVDRVNNHYADRHSQWWQDLDPSQDLDWQGKHDHSQDSRGAHLKKLYSRVDARKYTAMLEDLLKEKGVDVSKLRV